VQQALGQQALLFPRGLLQAARLLGEALVQGGPELA